MVHTVILEEEIGYQKARIVPQVQTLTEYFQRGSHKHQSRIIRLTSNFPINLLKGLVENPHFSHPCSILKIKVLGNHPNLRFMISSSETRIQTLTIEINP